MENNILLSLCIPTNGVVEWIIPVIDSIYEQGVDNALFEVVVTDNGEKDDLQEAVKKYDHNNFHYYRTKAQGFTNQIDAFEKCQGVFCKMLNHRSRMLPGSINALLAFIGKYQDTKPILYCAEGNASGGEYIECPNTDAFVKHMSYFVSWSGGTGAWKEDVNKNLKAQGIDSFFPHTVLLFGLRQESEYVIWNGKYEEMADDSGKGGYDLFRVFGVNLLDILNGLRISNRIGQDTFIQVKNDLYSFLGSLYFNEVLLPTNHTFIIQNVEQSICVYYGRYYYKKMIIKARLKKIKYNILKPLKK